MARVFKRGELKPALLAIVASLGEGHGYGIMQELQDRVGGDWRPSPGAIYPALLALEESGLLDTTEQNALRVYRLTERGRALLEDGAPPPWPTLTERAGADGSPLTLATLLDTFAAHLPSDRPRLSQTHAEAIGRTLDDAGVRIRSILEQGVDDG